MSWNRSWVSTGLLAPMWEAQLWRVMKGCVCVTQPDYFILTEPASLSPPPPPLLMLFYFYPPPLCVLLRFLSYIMDLFLGGAQRRQHFTSRARWPGQRTFEGKRLFAVKSLVSKAVGCAVWTYGRKKREKKYIFCACKLIDGNLQCFSARRQIYEAAPFPLASEPSCNQVHTLDLLTYLAKVPRVPDSDA